MILGTNIVETIGFAGRLEDIESGENFKKKLQQQVGRINQILQDTEAPLDKILDDIKSCVGQIASEVEAALKSEGFPANDR